MVWLTNLKDKDAQNHRQKWELSQIFAALEYSLKHFPHSLNLIKVVNEIFSSLKLSRIKKAWKYISFTEILTLLEKMMGKALFWHCKNVFIFSPEVVFIVNFPLCFIRKTKSPDRSIQFNVIKAFIFFHFYFSFVLRSNPLPFLENCKFGFCQRAHHNPLLRSRNTLLLFCFC